MSITGDNLNQPDGADRPRRAIFMIAGLVALLLIAGLIVYLKTRPEPKPASAVVLDQKLEGGFRAGSPEFEKHSELIKLDEVDAFEADSVGAGIQMDLVGTVRNFTGRTIGGLEMKGTVVDIEDKPIKERTMIIIPSASLPELEHNKTARVKVTVPGFTKSDNRANYKLEITAVKFK
jgi:hypothetical protein